MQPWSVGCQDAFSHVWPKTSLLRRSGVQKMQRAQRSSHGTTDLGPNCKIGTRWSPALGTNRKQLIWECFAVLLPLVPASTTRAATGARRRGGATCYRRGSEPNTCIVRAKNSGREGGQANEHRAATERTERREQILYQHKGLSLWSQEWAARFVWENGSCAEPARDRLRQCRADANGGGLLCAHVF